MKNTSATILKTILVAIFLLTFALPGNAQPHRKKGMGTGSGGARAAFIKGDKTLGFSLGFGVDYSYYGSVTSLPAFAVTYDQGIIEHVGPGTIGVGGIIGVKTAHYNYDNGYKATWNNYIIGVRATYHLTLLKDKNNKFDPYAGLMAGVRIYDYHDTYYDKFGGNPYTYSSAYPVTGAFIGARYKFSKHVSVFSEIGFDISVIRFGLDAGF